MIENDDRFMMYVREMPGFRTALYQSHHFKAAPLWGALAVIS